MPPDLDVDENMEGIALLTERNQPLAASQGPTSPIKPRIRLEAVFEPPTAKIVPQRLFSPNHQGDTRAGHLARKAPPETASPDRTVKRRAVESPRRLTRARSAVSTMEARLHEKPDVTLSPSAALLIPPTPSRIPTMMSSIKRMENKLGRSRSHAGIQTDKRTIVAALGTAPKVHAEEDVFGSPTA